MHKPKSVAAGSRTVSAVALAVAGSAALFGRVASAAEPTPAGVAAKAAAGVSAERGLASVQKLADFGTRHTLSDRSDESRGVGAAARWLRTQLEETSPDLKVTIEEFDAPKSVRLPEGARVLNVLAVLRGREPIAAGRAYAIVGHYDSRNGNALDGQGDAPGANDNASGTAAVLEAARAICTLPAAERPEATIVFMCAGAEEQGLIGARYHAEKLAAEKPYRLLGVLNNDIIGDPWGERHPRLGEQAAKPGPNDAADPTRIVRVFSEGLPRNPGAAELAKLRSLGAENDSASRQLARFVVEVAEREGTEMRPRMVLRLDRFLRGGDHSAFNEAGFAAVRFSVPHEDYSRQHADVTDRGGTAYGDTAEFIDGEYLAAVTRLNVATLMHLANAPSPPGRARILTASLESATTLRWDAAPEPDVAGYEVVWRTTTEAAWTGSKDAGNATELRLPISKDDVYFGVRSYDRAGYRSAIAFAVDAKE